MSKARNYMFGLGAGGFKWDANDLAGMVGLPSVGDIFYVDPGAGSDSANGGKDRDDAYATLTQAHTAMSADNNDIVIIDASSATGRTSEAAALTWSKRRTHVIGSGPSRRINSRQGVSFGASISPGLTISGNNCSFSNISIATFSDNNNLVEITSDYNTFNNVHFQGIGDDTAGDDTAARSLLLTASEENEFYNCTIGLDTVTRSAANASLELTGSCARNKFISCDFPIYADAATPVFVKADTGNAYERFLTFENCYFNNPVDGSSTAMTVGMDLSATGNGQVVLFNSYFTGCTDIANDFTATNLAGSVQATNSTGGLTIQAA